MAFKIDKERKRKEERGGEGREGERRGGEKRGGGEERKGKEGMVACFLQNTLGVINGNGRYWLLSIL